MQNDVGKSGQAFQARGPIEVGEQRAGAVSAPEGELRRVAQQREDPIVTEQARQGAAGHITAADDQ